MFSWQNSVSLCPVSFCTPRPNFPIILGISWLPTLVFQSLWWKRQLFLVSVLENVVGLHKISQLQLLQHQWLEHRLGLLWCQMFRLGKEPRSFCHFLIAPKYYISDSTVDYEGYSTSSKGFLLTIVDIMVIWIKFTHSYPYNDSSSKICVWPVDEKVLLYEVKTLLLPSQSF